MKIAQLTLIALAAGSFPLFADDEAEQTPPPMTPENGGLRGDVVNDADGSGGGDTLPPEIGTSDDGGGAWGFFMNPNVGTLGVGIDVGYEFNEYLKIRGHYGWLKASYSGAYQDIDYTGKFENEHNAGVFFDVHPFGGVFRLSVGCLFSDPTIRGEAKLRSEKSYDIGGDTYTAHGSVGYEGDYSWKNVQPYVGIGWASDGDGDRCFFFSFDIGVAFLSGGKFNTGLTGSSTAYITNDTTGERWDVDNYASEGNWSTLDASIRRELKDVTDFLDDLPVYPIISIGFGWRF